jgi:3-methyladenine DNA glycosylase AlkD
MLIRTWNKKEYQIYIKYLKSLSDPKYRDFHKNLTETKYEIIGIRVPIMRQIAKEKLKTDYLDFLKYCGDKYYEEVFIEGQVITGIKDEDKFLEHFYNFLDKIDNWAICDSFCNSLKRFKKNTEKYFPICKELALQTDKIFTSRVGLICILNHFIDELYLKEIFEILDTIKSDEYYLNMAEAWLVCEIYTKYPKETTKYLKKNKLNKFTQNKAISKIHDSYRVTKEEKEYLNTLKRK